MPVSPSQIDCHPNALNVRLFGPLRARLGEMPLPPLRSRKGEWLLALLVLRNAPVDRSWLAGSLWPESEESRALLYLRRELMVLRRALGHESRRLISRGRSLHLDLAGVDCDLLAFDAAVARSDASSLEEAISLYSGPLLEGCDVEWVSPEREAREQSCLKALEQLAEWASAHGDASAAICHLRAAAALDPLRESTHCSLMKALAESGNAAAATQVYHDLRRYLRNELNADADPGTTSLFQRIRDDARRRAPSPARHASRSGAAGHQPPILRIPSPLTRLIGRRDELWDLRRRIWNSRLLTLTGPGGIGKTRLAIELATQLKYDFAAGSCFVELTALSEAHLVSQAVMDGLAVKPESRRPAVEILAERIGTSDLLLVLDNCEHLIQACMDLAGTLLKSCANLRILTTSREPLGIPGESVWKVLSLAVPPSTDELVQKDKGQIAEVMEYESVALFVERAQQARSDFTLSVHNAEAVSRVCRRLDGIPLAIELAAARIRSLTVEDIDKRLDQRFQLLTRSSRTAASLGHHQTLRSLVDWSYDLLTEAEKALLSRLSVFSGGWTLEAAEQVCADPDPADDPRSAVRAEDVLDFLTSLADKNLIVAETFGASVRYGMLETMRQYARDRLSESGEGDVWRGRHLAYFAAFADEAEPHLTGSEQQAWLERLEIEHDNIRTALESSRAQPGSSMAGLRLAGAVSRFWSLRGHNREGRAWISSLLEIEPEKHEPAVRANALYGAASIAFDQGDASAAQIYIEEDLTIRRKLGDRRGIAKSLNIKANVATVQGDHAAGWAIREEGLVIWRELGDRWGIAVSLGNLGFAAYTAGDYTSAQIMLEESLAIRRDLGVPRGVAYSLLHLGMVKQAIGEVRSAGELFAESLEIEKELGNGRGVAGVLRCIGRLEFEKGDLIAAWSHLCESMRIHRDLGDRLESAFSIESAAPVAAHMGAVVCAGRMWGAAERLREGAGAPRAPKDLFDYHQRVSAARAALSDDAAFDAAWAEGREMTMEQAIELAMNEMKVKTGVGVHSF